MTTLSVIIIAKNEQTHIGDCIRSVLPFSDEIIVLDSDSSDQTCQIAQALGAKVFASPDWQGFGIQKNRALALATCDWILSLDADERVTPELAEDIKYVVRSNPVDSAQVPQRSEFVSTNAYFLERQSWYCGRLIQHSGWQEDQVLRLFRRGTAHFTNDLVHERVVQIPSDLAAPGNPLSEPQTRAPQLNKAQAQSPPAGLLKGVLLHYSFNNFDQVLVKVNRYSSLWAEQKAQTGASSSPLKAAVHGLSAFCKTYFFKAGFLDGAHGFALAVSNAEGAYYKYLKLWHLNQMAKSEGVGKSGVN
jgi:glycosyltransferase involved in cell wall biosynthesis